MDVYNNFNLYFNAIGWLENFLDQFEVNSSDETSRKAIRALSKPSFLKPIFDITKGGCFCRAIFFYASYDHESMCVVIVRTCRVSEKLTKQFLSV